MATGGAVGLRLEFYGDVQIERTLADRAERAADARPVWELITERFVAMELRQFGSEGGYASGGWAPLSVTYGEWKARNYPGKTILRREDDLYNSLTKRPLGIEVLEPQRMIIGSDVAHGAYHQKGDGVPQRRPIEFPESDRREVLKAYQRFVVTGRVN